MPDFSARPPVRALSPDEIEQSLTQHRLYLERSGAKAIARTSHRPI
jgi:hypothetical protein